MNSVDLAEGYLRVARLRLKYAELALEEDHAFCVRTSQEAVELSVKSILRLLGMEVPKIHEPARELLRNKDRLPSWLQKEVENISFISRWLSLERSPSFYGDEEEGIPPDELYDESYCRKALESARYVYEIAQRVFQEHKKSS
ncbi:MAG: DNA-binding protein [Metallosphaera javensis (ex Sakai et al. 2022)]|nr:MAG: DNA-binding protein [Metallosphaera javensis (ex Sakai et al. 2022)]